MTLHPRPDLWDMRAALRDPHRCPKHPDRESREFRIREPGRRSKRRYLCIECAAVLVRWHRATLEAVK